ncbi:hypothetical protein PLICRDRAFT_698364 [Plicaturopsis crispa FD-325 SS-3]|nr:hypothetical protein PLICRDRAFT_698364 [Plicaturopsis crispa FD-325 SS-3]
MPPKRKRTDEPASTRATRSSSRLTKTPADESAVATSSSAEATSSSAEATTSTKPTRKKAAPAPEEEEEEGDAAPPAKKAKAKAPRKTPVKKTSAKAAAATNPTASDDDAGPSTHTALDPEPEPVYIPYTASRALALFLKYTDADEDDPNTVTITPAGFERLCADARIAMDGAQPLVLAWLVKAAVMGSISKDEWVGAMGRVEIASLLGLRDAVRDLEELLIKQNPGSTSTSRPQHPTKKASRVQKVVEGGNAAWTYNRAMYNACAADAEAAFKQLYAFCFALAKPPQARNIDMETATALWTVVLAPRFPIMLDVVAFIGDAGKWKGVNRDLWGMMLEFCQTVHTGLEAYEMDGAWPTLLDEFVAWKRAGTGSA